MEKTSGVRKGAWTHEEDKLLKACIHKYGEGKWHLVPKKAGLNRCRKSCRLRWLNYLNPNINRGSFADDEVDMILRLHRLLGNRWTLIAGRIPGRTANDVKNYWHTHLLKKMASNKKDKKEEEKPKETMEAHKIKRPQPRAFSNHSPWSSGKQILATGGGDRESATPLVASNDDNVPKECDKEDNREKEKAEKTMKAHEIITPRPRRFSNHSPCLKGKHILANDGGIKERATSLVASNDDNVPRECETPTMLPLGNGVGDRDSVPQPYLDNDPQSTMWLESLLNLDGQISNEKIVGTCSLLSEQVENSFLEFPNVEDFFAEGPSGSDCFWNSNFCDFDSLWDL